MSRAAGGYHPFAPAPPADWGKGRAPWHYDLSRLGRAGTLLEQVLASVARPKKAVPVAARSNLVVHATAIGAYLHALRLVSDAGKRRTSLAAPLQLLNAPSEVVGRAVQARKLIEAVTGGLLRAAHTRSLDPAREDLARIVTNLQSLAGQVRGRFPYPVRAVAPPNVVKDSNRLSSSGGTYVVVLRVERGCVVRFARLGTFWFPEGYLLYVGSAFGGGGVAGRAARHLGGTGPRLWGVDHLRGVARPAALWWTHHAERAECTWARAPAGMACCRCTAPLAGASDCNRRSGGAASPEQRCPAHLFHAAGLPSLGAFAGQLGRSGSGGYEIHSWAAAPALAAAKGTKSRPARARSAPPAAWG
jgi:Uri superfamily endonuclease